MRNRKKYQNLTPEEKSAKRAKAEAVAEKAFKQDIKRSKYFTYIMVFVVIAILVGSFIVPRSKSGKGSNFYVSIPLDRISLDPQKSVNSWEAGVCSLIYEGLVKFDKKLVLEDNLEAIRYDSRIKDEISRYNVTRGLATDWHFDEKENTWTFTLRQDVLFHDTSSFTAASVISSFARLMGYEDISVDSSADFPARKLFSALEKIYKVGDFEVVFVLSKPDPLFLQKLALPQAAIISGKHLSKEKTAGIDLSNKTSGTGPYKLRSVMGNDFLYLSQNDAYWGNKGYPGINIFLLNDDNAALDAVYNEELDLILAGTVATATKAEEEDNLKQIKGYSRFLASVVVNPYAGDQTAELLSNPELRKTVIENINSREIFDETLFEYFNANQLPRGQENKRSADEIVKTSEKLQTQKYTKTPKIELEMTLPLIQTGYLPRITSIAQRIKSQLEDINVEVKLNILPEKEFFKKWMDGKIAFTLANFSDDWFYSLENFYGCIFTDVERIGENDFLKISSLQDLINRKDTLIQEHFVKELGHLLRVHVLVSSIAGESFKTIPSFFELLKSSE